MNEPRNAPVSTSPLESALDSLTIGTFASLAESLRTTLAPLGKTPREMIDSISSISDAKVRQEMIAALSSLSSIEHTLREAERLSLDTLSRFQWKQQPVLRPETTEESKLPLRPAHPIDLSKALVVVKLSKIEYHMQCQGLSYEQTLEEMKRGGDALAPRISAHRRHRAAVQLLSHYFRTDQIISRSDLDEERIKNASLIIAFGGDDHLAYVSQQVRNEVPVLGINSDPESSFGALLQGDAEDLPALLPQLAQGQYRFEPWSRLRPRIDGVELPPALGTIFIGEENRELMSRHLLSIRDSKGRLLSNTGPRGIEQKSSGLVIATGAGSTGWYQSGSRYLFPRGNSWPRTARHARFVLTEPSDTVIHPDGKRGVSPLLHGTLHEGESLTITSKNKGKGLVSIDSTHTHLLPAGETVTIEIDNSPLWIVRPQLEDPFAALSPDESHLVEAATQPFMGDLFPAPHHLEISRSRSPEGYHRAIVPDSAMTWEVTPANYRPTFYESKAVVAMSRKPKGWADPASLSPSDFIRMKREDRFVSEATDDVALDSLTGRPLNPYGRTGTSGRGNLGKWGPNRAVDGVVMYLDPKERAFKLLVVKRPDGAWALPGGFLDEGESAQQATLREIEEETSLTLSGKRAVKVFTGLCDDMRNTDNAWIETTASLFLLTKSEATLLDPAANNEVRDLAWITVTPETVKDLYASHPFIVQAAMRAIQSRHASQAAATPDAPSP